MASVIDVCNLALSHLGDSAQVIAISPPDGTVQAAHCARFYPLARDAVLQAFPWSFAVRRSDLALVTNALGSDWRYAYALPSDCLRPLAALYPGLPAVDLGAGESDTGSYPHVIESAGDGSLVLYTNTPTAQLRYIGRVTDPTKFQPLVVLAIARLLASYLAGPILKGDTGAKVSLAQAKLFEAEFAAAAAADARTGSRDTRRYRPEWITVRGYWGSFPRGMVPYYMANTGLPDA